MSSTRLTAASRAAATCAALTALAVAAAQVEPAQIQPAQIQPAMPQEMQIGEGSAPKGVRTTAPRGTFAQSMEEVARLAEEERLAEALELADSLLAPTAYGRLRTSLERQSHGLSEKLFGVVDRPLEWLGLERRTAADRAEVHYARGLVLTRQEAVESAEKAFELARVVGGPGSARLDAIYDLGGLQLELAESLRALVPEIASARAPAPAPAPVPAPGADGAPDPLPLARLVYGRAKEHFVERLREDWRDSDTRANLELVMRRLAELDRIEREREQRQQDQESQDREGEQDPEQEPAEQESGDQDPESGEQQEEGDPQDEQTEAPHPESQEEGAQDQDDERILTAEEMKRLLAELRRHDEEGERMRESLRGVRRVRVRRDW